MKLVARHYQTLKTLEIEIEQERYSQIKLSPINDKNLPFIAPGLVDIQINGFAGIDFNRPLSEEQWEIACRSLYATGCTHFLTTLITNTTIQLETLLENLENFRLTNPYNCIGFHLEGPFLNSDPDYRGVHNSTWMIPCEIELFKKWQTLTPAIRLITLAPEVNPEKALTLIQQATQQNVRVAIGHSSATGALLEQAIRVGASAWTHLGNGLASQIHKFENPIFYALAQPQLFCSLIPDGIHLPPHVFKTFVKALDKRAILTTDATAAAGASPGDYTLGETKITRDNQNRANKTGTEKLAGSTLTPFETVFKAAQLASSSWVTMWNAYSTTPAQWLGFPSHSIEKNNEANFCLFSDVPTPRLLATIHQGRLKFGQIPN